MVKVLQVFTRGVKNYVLANMAVFDYLKLHITSEKFIIEPVIATPRKEDLLVIDRVTQDISLQVNEDQIPASAITKTIYGIVGIIKLVAGPYLIVITQRKKVGEIDGHIIWSIAKTEVLSYKRSLTHLTERQMGINKSYLSLVDMMLSTEYFYYSSTYDITHSLQRLYNTSPDFHSMPLHERADQRFVWNSHVLRELAQQSDLARFCMPILLGFVSIVNTRLGDNRVDYVLLSRRCIFRAGTRFNVRGVDLQGQVANYVETEQMVFHQGTACSFIQTRGSIPMFWSQKANLKRLPVPVVMEIDHLAAFKKHLDYQIYTYGDQVIVNLVNHHGPEQALEKKLSQLVTNAQNRHVRYEPFDFHKECSRMRWDRLNILLDRLEPDRKRFGYFMQQRGQQPTMLQSGVFRTNCVDCLDRTNVVQSLIARQVLCDQLVKLGIWKHEKKLGDEAEFEAVFRNVWADNADVISKQYAGTGALKADFTRTGKRTVKGALQDGINTVFRYFKNNFQDGNRQDAMDLFLGNYVVEENEGLTVKSPLESERDWKYYAVPVILVVALSMFVISVLLPDEHLSEQMMYVLFWGVATIMSVAAISMYGAIFVDQPRLDGNKVKTE